MVGQPDARQHLVPQAEAGRAARGDILGLYPLGLTVNPRSKEPLLVVTDGTHVGVRSLKEASLLYKHGSGYYDTDGHGKSKAAENVTGYPRSHTPSGVTPQGAGYGTSLYTALSLGAYLVNNGHAKIEMDVEGDGISSESEGRSREADAWWDSAHNRRLTLRQTDETEEKEEYVKLDLDTDDLEGCVSLEDNQTLDYVNEVNVDITTTEEMIIDTYPYMDGKSSAWERDLVPAEFKLNDTREEEIPDDIPKGSELRWLVRTALDDADFFGDTDQTALLALDVRGLDVDAVNLLSLCYLKSGFGDKEVDAMWLRYTQNLDPSGEDRQLHLFSRNGKAAGLSDVVEARKQANWAALARLP